MSNIAHKPLRRSRAGYTGVAKTIVRAASTVAALAPVIAKAVQSLQKPDAKPAPAPQITISESNVQIVTSERHAIKWGPRRVNISETSA